MDNDSSPPVRAPEHGPAAKEAPPLRVGTSHGIEPFVRQREVASLSGQGWGAICWAANLCWNRLSQVAAKIPDGIEKMVHKIGDILERAIFGGNQK